VIFTFPSGTDERFRDILYESDPVELDVSMISVIHENTLPSVLY
jgi:hypothetical protein